MSEKKTKYSQRYVSSSSNIDKHGHVMTKEVLESSLKFINGERKPRLGLDHNRNFPPMGRINNGKVIERENHLKSEMSTSKKWLKNRKKRTRKTMQTTYKINCLVRAYLRKSSRIFYSICTCKVSC